MSRHVLVIEDNADLADLFELALLCEDYEVETTPSGLTGLVRFAEAPFDIVLLDMQIEDLSGLGAHRAIKDLSPRAAVVCMSAQTSGWRQDALSHGATACLPKPFPPDALVGLLNTITRSEHPSPAFPLGDVRTLEPRDLVRLAALSPAELDALPLGAIRLNQEGLITAYNAYEAEVARSSSSAVLGMPFSRLAPCTMVNEFLSAMKEGFRDHHMDRVLRFAFPYHGASRVVSVRLYYDPAFEQMWLFISTARGEASPLAILPPRRRPC